MIVLDTTIVNVALPSIREDLRFTETSLVWVVNAYMSRAQALRRVVAPQALRRITPVLASTWVSLFKDTSLVSVIAVTELAYVSMQIRAQTFRVLEMLTAMALIYWLLGYPQAKLVDWIQRRYAVTE